MPLKCFRSSCVARQSGPGGAVPGRAPSGWRNHRQCFSIGTRVLTAVGWEHNEDEWRRAVRASLTLGVGLKEGACPMVMRHPVAGPGVAALSPLCTSLSCRVAASLVLCTESTASELRAAIQVGGGAGSYCRTDGPPPTPTTHRGGGCGRRSTQLYEAASWNEKRSVPVHSTSERRCPQGTPVEAGKARVQA